MSREQSYQPLEGDNLGTYEKQRLNNKNSLAYGLVIMFKSTVGLSLLIIQYYFIKLGLIPSIVCTIITIFFINTLLGSLAKLADRVEFDMNIEIETLDDLTNAVLGSFMGRIVKVLLIVLVQVYNLVGALLISRYLANKAQEYSSTEILHQQWPYQVCFVLFLITLALLVVAPEKLKYTSTTSSILCYTSFIVLSVFAVKKIVNSPAKVDSFAFDSSYLTSFVPQMIYNFETIGSLFTVRSTMNNRKDVPTVFFLKNFICIPVYALWGVLFLYVCLQGFWRFTATQNQFRVL